MSILLTLSLRSLAKRLTAKGGKALSMLDLPAFVSQQLQLHGLNVQTSFLSGWSLSALDRLRDRADKVGCPCLVLIEDRLLAVDGAESPGHDELVARVNKLAMAASRLGCSALAIQCQAPDTPAALDGAVDAIKSLMPIVDRQQLNLLLMPCLGLTNSPDRLTELIKRVGGFRIGSLAEFGQAADAGDMVQVLRRLAPYAGTIHATVRGFDKNSRHRDYDLAQAVTAVTDVGFVNTIAIDYVGPGDPMPNIDKARVILEAAVSAAAE